MQAITTIGLDIAKSVFQVHGHDAEGNVLIRRQLKRRYVLAFFSKVATVPGWDRGLCHVASLVARTQGARRLWRALGSFRMSGGRAGKGNARPGTSTG